MFSDDAWEDYRYWLDHDPKTLKRLNSLIEECKRNPFVGTGKPEPLKYDLQGFWSRRVTQVDRLVYRVQGSGADRRLDIIQCRLHT